MLANVFTKSLYDQRRAILGWGVGIVALLLVEGALWPSIRDMPNLSSYLNSYPEAFRKLFNLEDFGTGAGFFNAELFSALLPILFIIFGIGRGARAIAGEEESGTLDVLLVTPVSNMGLVFSEAAALATSTLALGVVLWACGLVVSAAFGIGLGVADLAGATLGVVLIGVEFGWLALAAGAMTGRRSVAIGTATVAAVAAYVLYVAGQLVDAVKPWRVASPFYQALHAGPLGGGTPASYGWLILAGAVVVSLALPVFDRRDIGAR